MLEEHISIAGYTGNMKPKASKSLVFLPVLWYAGIRQKTTGVDTMAEQEMLLDTDTIRAAVAGEKWAKDKVIEHYTPMIDELAVDEDMKQHLILKLLEELPHFPMGQA